MVDHLQGTHDLSALGSSHYATTNQIHEIRVSTLKLDVRLVPDVAVGVTTMSAITRDRDSSSQGM